MKKPKHFILALPKDPNRRPLEFNLYRVKRFSENNDYGFILMKNKDEPIKLKKEGGQCEIKERIEPDNIENVIGESED